MVSNLYVLINLRGAFLETSVVAMKQRDIIIIVLLAIPFIIFAAWQLGAYYTFRTAQQIADMRGYALEEARARTEVEAAAAAAAGTRSLPA